MNLRRVKVSLKKNLKRIRDLNNFRSFQKLKSKLLSSELRCEDVVRSYLLKIKNHNFNNSFVETFDKAAIEQATLVDNSIVNNSPGKLAGMIIGIKDNICYENHNVSASSAILKGFTSLYSATVINRLISEGAIIIGRLNCDEFAMGSSNETSVYGHVKNPHDPLRVSGGSSGGSACAVAEGLCIAALGSDTGGSIRQPAAFCGVVGLKPTYSRVSRYGLIAYASSFDQIGPLTNNVEDAALILEVIAGKDKNDSTSSSYNVPLYSEFKQKNQPKRIAFIEESLNHEGLDDEIRKLIFSKIDVLRKKGHTIEPVSFPYLDYLVSTYHVLSTAEASSNLSRFDGINYGYRSEQSSDLNQVYVNSRTEAFGKEVKRRIMLGTFVLSVGYHEAYFTKAQKIRRIIKNKVDEIFKTYDFILTPTTPHIAFKIGEDYKDPTQMYLEDIFTVLANLSGNPAISLPLFDHSSKLPYGLQLMSENFEEESLLYFSKEIS
jgi:aspartyl-tRNA(Asn)/glutamyl-tRNA(Gln) amidotransferase subunit A